MAPRAVRGHEQQQGGVCQVSRFDYTSSTDDAAGRWSDRGGGLQKVGEGEGEGATPPCQCVTSGWAGKAVILIPAPKPSHSGRPPVLGGASVRRKEEGIRPRGTTAACMALHGDGDVPVYLAGRGGCPREVP